MDVAKNKVKLPYELWSMDKIKPTTDELDKWTKKYKGPYVISAKLDGISALYVNDKMVKKCIPEEMVNMDRILVI